LIVGETGLIGVIVVELVIIHINGEYNFLMRLITSAIVVLIRHMKFGLVILQNHVVLGNVMILLLGVNVIPLLFVRILLRYREDNGDSLIPVPVMMTLCVDPLLPILDRTQWSTKIV
jgi:hypothetical protein